jgi:hypothetical protein
MTIKKEYAIGDTVWIYGINRSNVKPAKGRVIEIVDLTTAGYSIGDHYVVEVPSHIEPLLEIRSWHNISQDEHGPVGSLRNLGNFESTIKFASRVGFAFDDSPELDSDENDPTPDEIHAAMEKSQKDSSHGPLVLKDVKSKRRNYPPRKKKV